MVKELTLAGIATVEAAIDAIAIIIDTSASLPGETLALFWAEVREIAAELQPDSIYVLQVDAVLRDAAQYPAGELPDSITIKGRGGTDFRPGFAWLHEQGVRPGCFPTWKQAARSMQRPCARP